MTNDNFIFYCRTCKQGYDPNQSTAIIQERYCSKECAPTIKPVNIQAVKARLLAKERINDPQLDLFTYRP